MEVVRARDEADFPEGRVEAWDGRPLGVLPAARALVRCAVRAAQLLLDARIRQPPARRDERFEFADGTGAAVYRETALEGPPPCSPAVLVVTFRLRGVRGEVGHALFRRESVLNTALFVGFPGFVTKLWLRHDERGRYRGLYEWDGAARALAYVGALARVLALVSARGTIRAVVLHGLRLEALLADPAAAGAGAREGSEGWWRLVAVEAAER